MVFMGWRATDEYVVKIDPEHMQGVQNCVATASSFQPTHHLANQAVRVSDHLLGPLKLYHTSFCQVSLRLRWQSPWLRIPCCSESMT